MRAVSHRRVLGRGSGRNLAFGSGGPEPRRGAGCACAAETWTTNTEAISRGRQQRAAAAAATRAPTRRAGHPGLARAGGRAGAGAGAGVVASQRRGAARTFVDGGLAVVGADFVNGGVKRVDVDEALGAVYGGRRGRGRGLRGGLQRGIANAKKRRRADELGHGCTWMRGSQLVLAGRGTSASQLPSQEG